MKRLRYRSLEVAAERPEPCRAGAKSRAAPEYFHFELLATGSSLLVPLNVLVVSVLRFPHGVGLVLGAAAVSQLLARDLNRKIRKQMTQGAST